MQVSSRCLAADAITSIAYPRIGVSTTIDLNARGSLLKSSTGTMTQTHFEQRLSYDELGRIGAQWASLGTERAQFNYNYDGVDRLIHEQYWNPTLPNPINEWRGFQYDRVGNRITSSLGGTTVAPSNQTYTYPPASNRLLQFTEGAPLAPPTRVHTLAYDPDGALQTRTRNDLTDGMEVQRIETFAYDAFELIHRYTVRRDVAAPGAGLGCAADAAQQPMDDWRYRFGPLQEREQKRQYATAGNAATDGLAWTYTLLGADAKQLATYNGVQGAFCGQPAKVRHTWPVEHNAWGPAGTRIIMRPTGAREYVVHDHLGSARLTYDNAGGVVERRSYRAFGVETQSDGEGARTSYIGREKDNESDLGFYGVRMYEPDYGRFLSVDPLWGLYSSVQPYHYSLNQPLSQIDDGGKWVEAKTPEAQDLIKESVSSQITAEYVRFNDNGTLDRSKLNEGVANLADQGVAIDPESNLGKLAYLANHTETVHLIVSNDESYQEMDPRSGQVTKGTFELSEDSFTPSAFTLAPRSALAKTGAAQSTSSSPTGMWTAIMDATPNYADGRTMVQRAAHELYGHIWLGLQILANKKKGSAWHEPKGSPPNQELNRQTKRSEDECR